MILMVCFALLVRYSSFKERLSSIMNNIEGQEVEGEQGCEGARVPDNQEHVEDEVQSKCFYSHFYSDFSIKSDGKEEDLCVSEKTS